MTEQAVSMEVLDRLVERAGTLYSLPAVAMEVLELTRQPRADARLLRACVERDPALTGKLLRVVNSSMFGLSREVTDLNQAVALLGLKPLKLLVLGFSLPVGLFSGVEALTLERYWQRTLLKAVAARELCQAYWNGDGDEAFIAGLLQDIGILVLIQELGDAYLDFLHSVALQQADLLALEVDTLGFDHVALSARLLDHWQLPTAIVQAVAAPAQLEDLAQHEADDSPLPQILHLASLVAAIIADGREDCMGLLLVAADRYRALTVAQIDALLDQMQERVRVMAQVFAVSADGGESYRDIMARAYAQMSQTAVEVLPDLVPSDDIHRGTCPQQALTHALDRFARGLSPQAASPDRPSARPQTTGLPYGVSCDPGLCGRIHAAITACRSPLTELSLVLWEMDHQADLLVQLGVDPVSRIMDSVPRYVDQVCDISGEYLRIGEARWAIVLRDCDRRQAAGVARALLIRWPAWTLAEGLTRAPVASSAGVATLTRPSRHSHAEDLIVAAERCLFAAQSCGGHVVKSIDVLA